MFSDTVQQILANPTHIGPLEGATHCGTAGTPGEGPYMQIWLEIDEVDEVGEVKIMRAAFKTFGCPSATASGSMICRLLTGMAVEKAKLLTAADLLLILGGLPEGREFCAELCVEALREALP
jgi:nitrogen fixation NifU-like protein